MRKESRHRSLQYDRRTLTGTILINVVPSIVYNVCSRNIEPLGQQFLNNDVLTMLPSRETPKMDFTPQQKIRRTGPVRSLKSKKGLRTVPTLYVGSESRGRRCSRFLVEPTSLEFLTIVNQAKVKPLILISTVFENTCPKTCLYVELKRSYLCHPNDPVDHSHLSLDIPRGPSKGRTGVVKRKGDRHLPSRSSRRRNSHGPRQSK